MPDLVAVTPKEIRLLVQPFAEDFATLSFAMDPTHAEEFARYDRQTGVLHINAALLPQAPVWAVYFYIYKALRYAHQCRLPDRFDAAVQRSLPYAIWGIGKCAKWDGKRWLPCKIEGDKEFFEEAWRSLPYEMECVEYATYEAYDMLSWDSDRDNLHLLAQLHAPRKQLDDKALADLYGHIDAQVGK